MKMKNYYRYVVAALLFCVGAVNYMDRAAIGVVASHIQSSFGLSPSQMGFTFSTFFIGYAIFAFVGGHAADRFGPKRSFTCAALGWSLFCALTGVVTGFASLLVVRTIFGFAEGPMNSMSNRTITNWFPRNETARAVGFLFAGQTVGTAIAAPIVVLLLQSYDWHFPFFAFGLIGIVWVVLWLVLFTDKPRDNSRVTTTERDIIERSRAAAPKIVGSADATLWQLLQRPSVLALGSGMFAVNYVLFIFLSWLPSYLTDSLHLEIKQMAFAAAIPWMGGLLGCLFGGVGSDLLYSRSRNKVLARKLTTVVPLAVASLALLLVAYTHSATPAVALIAFAVMLLFASVQSCWAMIHDLVPASHVGGVSGFLHLLSSISGIIGPTVTGFAVQYLGGYNSVFFMTAAIALGSVLIMFFFIRSRVATPQAEVPAAS
jgi:ACS family hexuronate transporter-like MFS transporter